MTANTEVAILDRVIRPEAEGLTPEAAAYILKMAFQAEDHRRMEELASKAREGSLTPDEQGELDEYRRVADLLALLHSRARQALRASGSNG